MQQNSPDSYRRLGQIRLRRGVHALAVDPAFHEA